MKRLLILVEGQTEARFVLDVLRDHLIAHEVFPVSTILVSKVVNTGPHFKGGVTRWLQIEQELRRLLGDTGAAGVTTLVDFYGLPKDAPGMSTRPQRSPRDRVEHVERAIAARIDDRRFRAHLSLHELEALPLTDISKWEHRFENAAAIAGLKAEVADMEPEAINETPRGAPSKRILSWLKDYSKVQHSPLAIRDIGLVAVRAACPHFASWLAWAESLGKGEDNADSAAHA